MSDGQEPAEKTGPTPVFIRAVPWVEDRAANARALAEQTGGKIIWDAERSGRVTFLAAMHAAGDGPSVHLEDDVTLTSRWREKIEAKIAANPGTLLQFFSMRGADLTTGSRDEPGRTFLMTQCFYLPAGYASAIAAFGETWSWRGRQREQWRAGQSEQFDLIITDWLRANQLRYRIEVPSLVEHYRWRSVDYPGRPQARQSATFEP